MNRTIPEQESLTVEFKSDRTRLPDKDLIETVVCLANTDGGSIYLGVEDDGQITGLHPQHQNLSTKAAMIGNRTNPPVSVRAAPFKHAPRLFKHASIQKRSGTIPLI
jgi:ATP-dependent DNA helicase RecG